MKQIIGTCKYVFVCVCIRKIYLQYFGTIYEVLLITVRRFVLIQFNNFIIYDENNNNNLFGRHLIKCNHWSQVIIIHSDTFKQGKSNNKKIKHTF